MVWDRIEGQWKQRRGKAEQQWGKVMNDELAAVAGKYAELVGGLQEKLGTAGEEANHQIIEYKRIVERLTKRNARLIEEQKALNKRLKPAGKTGTSKTPAAKKLQVKVIG